MNKGTKMKKAFALLLSFIMVISMMPSMAFAADDGTEPISVSTKYLRELSFGSNAVTATGYRPFALSAAPEGSEYDYVVVVEDSVNGVSPTMFLSDAAPEDAVVTAKYYMMGMANKPMETKLTIKENGYTQKLALSTVQSAKPADLTLAVGNDTDVETIKILMKKRPTLASVSGLSLSYDSDGQETALPLRETVQPGTWDYSSYIPAGTDCVKVKTTATLRGAQPSEISVDGRTAVPAEATALEEEITLPAGYREVSVPIRISHADSDLTGDYTLKLIEQPERLEIAAPPTKTEYMPGDKFDPAGMVVKAYYADGKSETVTEYETSAKSSVLQGSDTAIQVTYKGVTAEQPITVEEPFDGNGSSEAPYELKTADDLVKLSSLVKSGITFEGVYFQMKADITLPAQWNPIGSFRDDYVQSSTTLDKSQGMLPFSGIFDGGNFTLTVPKGGLPLFGYVREVVIRNLNIYGEQIDGYGLINNYVVDYGRNGSYGSNGSGVPKTATIENVTILENSRILQSGFIGGYASGANIVTINNCKIQKGVTIGYDKSKSNIGSFAGSFNGYVTNSVSEANVYGVNNAGGLIGVKGQAMGPCSISNSIFKGNVDASGSRAGGIIGSGYDGLGTAPNTPVVSVKNCYVDGNVKGTTEVGGILGSEPGCECCWGNGTGTVSCNHFYGQAEATGADGVVGGIIGFMKSVDKYQGMSENYYLAGEYEGIGKIETIVTKDHPRYGEKFGIDGTFDSALYCKAATAAAFTDGTVLDGLNGGMDGFSNWTQGTKYPEFDQNEPVLSGFEISEYKNQYYVGESISTEGMKVIANYSDGSSREGEISADQLTFEDFDSSAQGKITVKAKYKSHTAYFDVNILPVPTDETITVQFTLKGDTAHGDKSGTVHTLAADNLETWIDKSYTVNANTKVVDLLELALNEYKMTMRNPTGNYIEAIYRNGVELAEFTNGKNSGWMYTLNGTHPLLGVDEQYLKNGDVIVFHYTDDYTKEEGSDKWNVPADDSVTKDVPASVKGDSAEVSVSASDLAALADAAAESGAAQVQLNVTGADKVDKVSVELQKTAVSNIMNKTDADLTVATPLGSVTMDKNAMSAAVKAASGSDITIVLEKQEIADVNKETLGGGAQTRVSVLSGGKEITDLGTAKLKILLPVTDELKDQTLAAASVGADGKLTQIDGQVVTVDGKAYYQIETAKPGSFVVAEAAGVETVIKAQGETDAEKAGRIKAGVQATTIKLKSTLNKRSVKLTWTKSKGYKVDGYQIYRSTKKSFGYKKYATAKTLTYTNKASLKKGTRYYYKVRGYRVIDGKTYYTKWSNKAYRLMKADSVDYGVKATTVKAKAAASKGSVKVTWTKSKGYKADGYEVYRSTSKTKNFKKLGSTAKTSYKNTKSLKAGTTYYYKVRGYRTLDGKKAYTKWSQTISVKAK